MGCSRNKYAKLAFVASTSAAALEIRPKPIRVFASRVKAGRVGLSENFAQTARMMSGAKTPAHSHQCHVVTRKYEREASASR